MEAKSDVLTVVEVAKRLGLSQASVYRAIELESGEGFHDFLDWLLVGDLFRGRSRDPGRSVPDQRSARPTIQRSNARSVTSGSST